MVCGVVCAVCSDALSVGKLNKQTNSTLPVLGLLAARCSLVLLFVLIVDRDLGSLGALDGVRTESVEQR